MNSPQEHRRAMEFDLFHPALVGLTPESRVVSSVEEALSAATDLGFPLFIKGLVKSAKDRGLVACVAHNSAELRYIVSDLLHFGQRSRGRVVLRRFVPLRHTRSSAGGFPAGREFRVFLYNNGILEYGYYWDGEDDLAHLTASEESAVLALAIQASSRLTVPFIVVDIGQTQEGDWIVIEVNDAQFAGHSQISLLRLWH